MLQALYFCKPFREKVLEYKAKNKKGKETLLSCLADLFYSIATQKKKVGTIAPKKFIARLRKEKVDFDNYMQQDAHEFLNFLINHINEIIVCKSFWPRFYVVVLGMTFFFSFSNLLFPIFTWTFISFFIWTSILFKFALNSLFFLNSFWIRFKFVLNSF